MSPEHGVNCVQPCAVCTRAGAHRPIAGWFSTRAAGVAGALTELADAQDENA